MSFLREDIMLIIILLNIIRNNQITNLLKIINYIKYSSIILNGDLNILLL